MVVTLHTTGFSCHSWLCSGWESLFEIASAATSKHKSSCWPQRQQSLCWPSTWHLYFPSISQSLVSVRHLERQWGCRKKGWMMIRKPRFQLHLHHSLTMRSHATQSWGLRLFIMGEWHLSCPPHRDAEREKWDRASESAFRKHEGMTGTQGRFAAWLMAWVTDDASGDKASLPFWKHFSPEATGWWMQSSGAKTWLQCQTGWTLCSGQGVSHLLPPLMEFLSHLTQCVCDGVSN